MPRVLPDPTGPVTRVTPTRVESSSLSHRRTRGTKWRGGMGIVPLRCSGTHGWSPDRSFDTISGTWRGSVVATGATRPVSFFTSPPSWHGCRRLSVDLPVRSAPSVVTRGPEVATHKRNRSQLFTANTRLPLTLIGWGHPFRAMQQCRTSMRHRWRGVRGPCPCSVGHAGPRRRRGASRDILVGVVVVVDTVATELRAQRPDDEDVEGDDKQRPERVVRQEGEVGDRAEARHRNPREVPHCVLGDDRDTDGQADNPDEQVDPSPCRDVKLVGVVHSLDEDAVVRDGGDTLQDLEHRDDGEHDTGEPGYSRSQDTLRRHVIGLSGLDAAHGVSLRERDLPTGASEGESTGDSTFAGSWEAGGPAVNDGKVSSMSRSVCGASSRSTACIKVTSPRLRPRSRKGLIASTSAFSDTTSKADVPGTRRLSISSRNASSIPV